jgi:hypothetical protein
VSSYFRKGQRDHFTHESSLGGGTRDHFTHESSLGGVTRDHFTPESSLGGGTRDHLTTESSHVGASCVPLNRKSVHPVRESSDFAGRLFLQHYSTNGGLTVSNHSLRPSAGAGSLARCLNDASWWAAYCQSVGNSIMFQTQATHRVIDTQWQIVLHIQKEYGKSQNESCQTDKTTED